MLITPATVALAIPLYKNGSLSIRTDELCKIKSESE
nr:hypothetical protein [Enterococcus faecium]